MRENKTSVIIVGGGIAGISCAITLARAEIDVIVIERGDFSGAKNMFGGAIYTDMKRQIFHDFEQNAPLERKNIENDYLILSENSSTNISHKYTTLDNSYTVIRAKFDRWAMEEAKRAGAIFVPNTCVRELIKENNKVVGIKTDFEEYFADIVILADGVNSLLAKQIGLRKDIKPKDVALSVKEVIKLPSDAINSRFNLKDDEGVIYQIFGYPMKDIVGLGFLYTNKDTVSIGLGVNLEDLIETEQNPSEILDKLKEHSSIKSLLEGGEMLEYSAHLIPEGGYKKNPKLFDNGVLVIGDAASLVNNLHFEGTNLAMMNGKLAAETVIKAVSKNDFSAKYLKQYQKKLEKSFVIKDLKTYQNLIPLITERKKSFMGFYLDSINEFFSDFISANGVPKKDVYRKFIGKFLKSQNFIEFFKDFFALIRILWRI